MSHSFLIVCMNNYWTNGFTVYNLQLNIFINSIKWLYFIFESQILK